MGCWERLRNVPHTSTTSCVLSGRPWNLPHPIYHPGIFSEGSFLGLGGGGGRGSGLTVPLPERVQLATLLACLMSTGPEGRGRGRRRLQPPNPICLQQSLQLTSEERVCAVLGCTFVRTHVEATRGEQVGCVTQALSPIHGIVLFCCPVPPFPSFISSSSCLFQP